MEALGIARARKGMTENITRPCTFARVLHIEAAKGTPFSIDMFIALAREKRISRPFIRLVFGANSQFRF